MYSSPCSSSKLNPSPPPHSPDLLLTLLFSDPYPRTPAFSVRSAVFKHGRRSSSGHGHGARGELRPNQRRARLLPRGVARGPRRPGHAPRHRRLARPPRHPLRPPFPAAHQRRQWPPRDTMFLDRGAQPDAVDRHKETPLMLAAMHGTIGCVLKLLQAGANILMFDSVQARTCLHHAAYYGHVDCLEAILSAAHTTPVAHSWGFARFVNVRDDHGAMPLHRAARQGRPGCLQVLLENGAIVLALTGSYGFPGSTSLHLAARSRNLDCIRKLLAWGADRLQRDSAGRIPYTVAHKRNHGACAALLNPSSAEPMVWPSPLKFISELDPEAKALLEAALMEANREREKKILKDAKYSPQSPSHYDDNVDEDTFLEVSDTELCCICFDQAFTIEVQDCGHQMCAPCTLALCCHNKPNPSTLTLPSPACPFCRGSISWLVVAQTRTGSDSDRPTSPQIAHRRSRRSQNLSEGGSSSFKGLLGHLEDRPWLEPDGQQRRQQCDGQAIHDAERADTGSMSSSFWGPHMRKKPNALLGRFEGDPWKI